MYLISSIISTPYFYLQGKCILLVQQLNCSSYGDLQISKNFHTRGIFHYTNRQERIPFAVP